MKIGSLSEWGAGAPQPVRGLSGNPAHGGDSGQAGETRTDVQPPPGDETQSRSGPGSAREVSGQELDHMVKSLNDLAGDLDTDLLFRVDKGTGRVVVSVVDVHTGETVKEIPPQEIVRAFSRLQEVVGLLFDRKM